MKAPPVMMWLIVWLFAGAACSMGAELPRMVLIAECFGGSKSPDCSDRLVAVLGRHEIAAVVADVTLNGWGKIGVWSADAEKARKVIEEAIRTEGLPVKLLPEEEKPEVPSLRARWRSVLPPAPPAAQQAADAYFASLPTPLPEAMDRKAARIFYLDSFFRGFVSPRSWISQGSDQSKQAHEAGKAYWRSHSEDLGKIMAGFGYAPVRVEGRWWIEFERSEFRPNGSGGEQKWWLSMLDNVDSDLPRTGNQRPEGIPLRIAGYLSPPGSHGHMGMADHEFFATKIRRLPESAGAR